MVENRKNTDKIAIQSFTVPRAREWAKRASAAEGASEASSPEQVNKWAVQANERTDERVAQYFSLYSWLFSTIVASCYALRCVASSILNQFTQTEFMDM